MEVLVDDADGRADKAAFRKTGSWKKFRYVPGARNAGPIRCFAVLLRFVCWILHPGCVGRNNLTSRPIVAMERNGQ